MVAQATLMHTTATTEGTKRFKCPVHHGKNLSVAVGFINGRAWAKCWSHGCSQSDILAALGITNSPVTPLDSATYTCSALYHPSITPLPPVSHAQALDYLKGIKTHEGAAVFYQRNDGQSGKHWRNLDMRRNPGVTDDGWQVRRFNPNDPSAAVAIALTEGEKDAAQLSAAGLITFTAPRGAQSLPGADFTELVALAKDTGLPVLLCGDNDLVGREAMRKVRAYSRRTTTLTPLTLWGQRRIGSRLPRRRLASPVRLELLGPGLRVGRNRAETGPCISNTNAHVLREISRVLATYQGYGAWCHAEHRHLQAVFANGKTFSTSRGVGGESPLRWLWWPASVRSTQPLLKQWVWARFTGGSWKTDYGKNPPFTRSKKTLLVNGGFYNRTSCWR